MRKTFVSLAITLLVAACASTTTTPAPSQAPAESAAPVEWSSGRLGPGRFGPGRIGRGERPGGQGHDDHRDSRDSTRDRPEHAVGAARCGPSAPSSMVSRAFAGARRTTTFSNPSAELNKVPDFWIADTDLSHLQPGIIEADPRPGREQGHDEAPAGRQVGGWQRVHDGRHRVWPAAQSGDQGRRRLLPDSRQRFRPQPMEDGRQVHHGDRQGGPLAGQPVPATGPSRRRAVVDDGEISVETKKHVTGDDPWAANWVNQWEGWPSSPANASHEEQTSASSSSRSGLTSVTRPPAGGATSVLDVSSMRSTGRSSWEGAGVRSISAERPATCSNCREPARSSLRLVSIDELIRTRRTHKAYAPEPVDRATLEELFELARWAPNHHLTNPWRFRVLGPQALARAEGGRRPGGRGQARPRADARGGLGACRPATTRSPTRRTSRAAACATYIVLLGAHARGLGGYWRTPAVLRTPAGRAALRHRRRASACSA